MRFKLLSLIATFAVSMMINTSSAEAQRKNAVAFCVKGTKSYPITSSSTRCAKGYAKIGITATSKDNGTSGQVGPQGLPGADGPVGPQGPKGDTGATGANGADGAQGATGPKGDKGDAGFSGASRKELAPGVHFIGVNRAIAGIDAGAGVGSTDAALVRLLNGNSTTPGSYNGGGLGNKAIIGLTGYDKLPINQLQSISFSSKIDASNPPFANFYLNMLVDINCDELNPAYVMIVAEKNEQVRDGSYKTYNYVVTENSFRSVGGVYGLPIHGDVDGLPLTGLTNYNSGACLVDANIFDGGMPRNTIMPAILLATGDSNTNTPRFARIDNITVTTTAGTNTYDFD